MGLYFTQYVPWIAVLVVHLDYIQHLFQVNFDVDSVGDLPSLVSGIFIVYCVYLLYVLFRL